MKYFALSVVLAFSLVLGAQSASYFINEISYTASNPAEKGFEIVGTAGTTLSGWTAIQYDADGWQQTATDLSNQIIPNQQNGYGTIWYDLDQGGDSGGIALIDPSGTVQQFLAYGTLLGSDLLNGALDGTAAGAVPEYIDLISTGNNALQLVGTGDLYPTFFWASTQAASLGQVNDNQFFIPMSLGLQGNSEEQVNASQNDFRTVAWPNPTTDFFRVSVPETTVEGPRVLSLYDQNGRQLIRQKVSAAQQTLEVDVRDLPAGMYYLTIYSNDNPWQSELVIK